MQLPGAPAPPPAQRRPVPRPQGGATGLSGARRQALLQPSAVAAPAERLSPAAGPIILDREALGAPKGTLRERAELVQSLGEFAEEQVLPLLKDPGKMWQPQGYLPAPESPDFLDQVAELRQRCEGLPPEYLVVLVGDMITEEALPTYMAMLNGYEGVRDESGSDPSPWARWTRQWVAEENRHGDLMNKYCYLSGKVNMRAVEVTIQNLVGSGMDIRTENDPYLGFVYTSFQERATKVSHGNTARQAVEYGDEVLGKLCGAIAADESRHEIAYTRIVDEFFRLDPDGAMLAFADMMRKQIVMPAHLMDDGQHNAANGGRNLFADYSDVAQAIGVYTASDYCDIMEHLIARWRVNERRGLSAQAAEAQDYLMGLPPRFRKLAERAEARKQRGAKKSLVKFSWVFNEPLEV